MAHQIAPFIHNKPALNRYTVRVCKPNGNRFDLMAAIMPARAWVVAEKTAERYPDHVVQVVYVERRDGIEVSEVLQEFFCWSGASVTDASNA